MTVLILHHIEPCWEDGYQNYALPATTFEEFAQKVAEYITENSFSRIILTRFDEWKLTDEYWMWDFYPEVHAYSYGWEADMFERDDMYCEGGNHSKVVYIAEWMHTLPKTDVYIAGCFDGKCIEDLEIALDHLDIDYQRIEELIV